MSRAPTGRLTPSCCSIRPGQAPRKRHPAAANAHQDQVIGPAVALDDLVRDAGEGATQLVGVKDAAFAHAAECSPGMGCAYWATPSTNAG